MGLEEGSREAQAGTGRLQETLKNLSKEGEVQGGRYRHDIQSRKEGRAGSKVIGPFEVRRAISPTHYEFKPS